ncbi:Ohr family peroxiredoxin [Lysobacter solisilvae (ex Woo and Kim 2020)]|uniref:Ohr family peroxiredoxin n=1 Tax=Agrilutibacter terrestris TaxID=2865112 RepID=A0A7H0G0U0_9GAMM|nr:Ohr family peroxiredoxin [Lysobacter terrestris]QNP41906.1 Ohr family peroxiredoxin [Lysobacter terrestris]
MNKLNKVLFTGKTHTTVSPTSTNGHVNVDLRTSSPGGEDLVFTGVANHPTAEQLFAGAWSACYIGALGLVASQKKVTLPDDLSVDIEIDLVLKGNDYVLQARFDVRVPGFDQETAELIAHKAHEICPYSKATHNNIDVALNVTTS